MLNQILIHNKAGHIPPLIAKILMGIFAGILGCILMIYTVHVNDTVLLDFRNVPIMLVSVYAGAIPAFASTLIIGIFRILYFGYNTSSLTGSCFTMLICFGCIFISNANLSLKKKWIYSVICLLIAGSLVFVILIKDASVLGSVLIFYCIGVVLVCFFLYNYVEYLRTSFTMYKRLKEEAKTDFLTGLNNVREFDSVYNRITQEVKAKNEKLALIYIDVDFFKRVNDTYGHYNGDIVLKQLGKLLIDNCRSFDIVTRNGGEEFSILLRDCPEVRAVEIAERIRHAVENNIFIMTDGKKIKITISLGVAVYPDTTLEIDKLIEEADNALYKAKRTGRNKAVLAQYIQ
jgi:diguanylate cyclase (GGDEF) domain